MPQRTKAAAAPRIVLIHAVREAIDPVRAAFATAMPTAQVHDLLDTSLSADLAADGGKLGQPMIDRFLTLGRYAAGSTGGGRRTDAILFTCSAFGPAIEAVQRELPIPVLKPNEAAFRDALGKGGRIGLLVTFEPSLAPLAAELKSLAAEMGKAIDIVPAVVPPAMAALRAGRGDEHDAMVAAAAQSLSHTDVIVLGQFSTARAAQAVNKAAGKPVVTTPASAVADVRRKLGIA